jgi:hypothetical protein
MNYIWDLVINARQAGVPMEKLTFIPARIYSPYMELSNEHLNFKAIEPKVELNPYYRFYEIFKDLFDINNEEDRELRDVLFDVAIHFLIRIDLRQGMNRTEYYLRFILRELAGGSFGPLVRERFGFFNESEQYIVAENIYRLLLTGAMLTLLKNTIRRIFKNATIYANYETANELLFFIPCEKSELNVGKLELITELFLPLQFITLIYWQDHFGVIGMDETMHIDHIAMY